MLIRRLMFCLGLSLCSIFGGPFFPHDFQQAHGQVAALATVGAVQSALEDTIKQIREATSQLGAEFRSLGTSYESNARRVLADLDERLGKRLDDTFNKLDAAERKIVDDAKQVIELSSQVAQQLMNGAFDQARRTLV